MKIIIIGAGIAGLSTAYALRKRNVDVTVIERGPIPNPLAASSDHHRNFRPYYGSSLGLSARITDAFAAWRDMWHDLPQSEDSYFANTGMLALSRETGDTADQSRATMAHLKLPFEQIDTAAEISSRFPFLADQDLRFALLSHGGALMANRIMIDLADWLRKHGAILREHSPAAQVNSNTGQVILASGEVLEADKVLVCAGVGTASLLPDIAATLRPNRTIIAYADPPPDLRSAWRNAPCWADLGGTTEYWGMAPVHGLPLKLGNGAFGTQDETDGNRRVAPTEAQAMLNSYKGLFKGADRFQLRWAQANYWTYAPDYKFFLRQQNRVLALSACSGHGFKFGALTGQDAARALLEIESTAAVADRMAG